MQQQKLNLTTNQLNAEILSLVEAKNETGSFFEKEGFFDADLYLIIEQKYSFDFDSAIDDAVEYKCDYDEIDFDTLTEAEVATMYQEETARFIEEVFYLIDAEIIATQTIDTTSDLETLVNRIQLCEDNNDIFKITTNFISSNDDDLKKCIFDLDYDREDEKFEIKNNSSYILKWQCYGGREFIVNTYIKLTADYLNTIQKNWDAINTAARLEMRNQE